MEEEVWVGEVVELGCQWAVEEVEGMAEEGVVEAATVVVEVVAEETTALEVVAEETTAVEVVAEETTAVEEEVEGWVFKGAEGGGMYTAPHKNFVFDMQQGLGRSWGKSTERVGYIIDCQDYNMLKWIGYGSRYKRVISFDRKKIVNVVFRLCDQYITRLSTSLLGS